MKKIIILLLFSFFISTSVFDKSLEEKKGELKKIYEAGGISKTEYNRSVDSLKNPRKKEKKKTSIFIKKEKDKEKR